MLLFEEKVTQNRSAFISRIKKLASTFRINPNWLMAMINSETGGTFRSNIYNMGGSGAVGLIQFMPATAKAMGTTTQALASLSNVEQLDWVEKYLKMQLGYTKMTQIADYDDLYFLVFYPAAVGKPDNYVIPLYGVAYEQNKGIDMNKDGKITVADFKQFIHKNIPATEYITFMTQKQYKWGILVLVVLVLFFIGWGLWLFRERLS